MVELLSSTPISHDLEAIARRASERSNARVEVLHAMAIGFPDIRVRFQDADLPYSVSFLPAGLRTHAAGDWIDVALRQTWTWDRDEARSVATGATEALFLSDILGGSLDHRLRLPAFHAVVASAVEILKPDALHWVGAERLLKPSFYLADADVDPAAFESTVNVRYVTISDRPGEQLMDTVGLSPFLIPDVQMHFTTLEPEFVATKLLGIARYLYDHGDIIEDGETVPGRADGEKWPCHHEEPMLGPARVVLDVDPWPYGPRRS